MPQAARSRSRAPVVFLLLVLLAFPVFAGKQGGAQAPEERGFLASLWQAVAGFFPLLEQLGPELDPLGGSNGAPGDLGPGLDPLGSPNGAPGDLGPSLDPLG